MIGCRGATPNTGTADGGYDRTYAYTAGGNITQLGSVTDYTYTTGGRNDYGVDDTGPHAVVTAGGVDYSYDDVGNLTGADDDGATITYSYDDLNRLVAVDSPTGDDLVMVYDAGGNRVSRSQGDTTITYIGDLYEVEWDGESVTETRTHYHFGGEHIAVRTDDGTTDTITYLFTDHLGSVAATYQAGTAGGTYRDWHYYYPYGAPRGTPVGRGHYRTSITCLA